MERKEQRDGKETRERVPGSVTLLWVILLVLAGTGFAAEHAAAQGVDRETLKFIVVMKTGDSFRGNVVAHTDTTLIVQTEFNKVTIDKSLIKEFIPVDGPYTKRPLHFLMPTAAPNGPGGFISNYELGFLYGGFGIGSGVTITAGMTIVPGFSLSSQLYHANAKFTVEQSDQADVAVGATYTFLTTRKPYAHIYGVGTTKLGTGRWSAMLFYRISGDERGPVDLYGFGDDTTSFNLFYEGALGVAFGFDAPAFGRDDISFFGEIWNNDVTRPQNTASIVGVRIANEVLSADFGVALIAVPLIAPAMSFTWKL